MGKSIITLIGCLFSVSALSFPSYTFCREPEKPIMWHDYEVEKYKMERREYEFCVAKNLEEERQQAAQIRDSINSLNQMSNSNNYGELNNQNGSIYSNQTIVAYLERSIESSVIGGPTKCVYRTAYGGVFSTATYNLLCPSQISISQ